MRRTCYFDDVPTPPVASEEIRMNLKLLVAVVVMAAVPVCAQAQQQKAAPKPTKAAAQRVVQIIGADKAKVKTYCDLASLGEQMDQAEQKKDVKKVEEIAKKADDLANQLGPEYAALMDGLQQLDQNSKDGKDIDAVLEDLDKLCAKK
jgi:hypothetical protein